MESSGDWVRVATASTRLGVPRSTVRHWIKIGVIPADAIRPAEPRGVEIDLERAGPAVDAWRSSPYRHSEETKRRIGANQPHRKYDGETRACVQCDREFWARGWSIASGRDPRWCSKGCRMRWLREHEPETWARDDLNELRQEALDEFDQLLAAERSWFLLDEVAEQVGVSREAVWHWITKETFNERGEPAELLAARLMEAPGRRLVWVVEEADLRRFLRANARRRRFQRWEREKFVENWRQERKLPGSGRERVRKRRKAFASRRSTGASRKTELHAEWQAMFAEWRSRLAPGWSDWEVCKSVADEHFRMRRGAWRKYEPGVDGGLRPEDESRATLRVYQAIQRLLTNRSAASICE